MEYLNSFIRAKTVPLCRQRGKIYRYGVRKMLAITSELVFDQ